MYVIDNAPKSPVIYGNKSRIEIKKEPYASKFNISLSREILVETGRNLLKGDPLEKGKKAVIKKS